MTIDELLKPRYKVIADYPDSEIPVGSILYRHDWADNGTYCYVTNEDVLLLGKSRRPAHVEGYPHLFKKLEWWEERTDEDLIGLTLYHKEHGGITKVHPPISTDRRWFVWDNLKNSVPFSNYLPYREEEYHAFISQTATK